MGGVLATQCFVFGKTWVLGGIGKIWGELSRCVVYLVYWEDVMTFLKDMERIRKTWGALAGCVYWQ